MGFDLGMQGYSPERATTFVNQLEQRASSLPGVQIVSFTEPGADERASDRR